MLRVEVRDGHAPAAALQRLDGRLLQGVVKRARFLVGQHDQRPSRCRERRRRRRWRRKAPPGSAPTASSQRSGAPGRAGARRPRPSRPGAACAAKLRRGGGWPRGPARRETYQPWMGDRGHRGGRASEEAPLAAAGDGEKQRVGVQRAKLAWQAPPRPRPLAFEAGDPHRLLRLPLGNGRPLPSPQ